VGLGDLKSRMDRYTVRVGQGALPARRTRPPHPKFPLVMSAALAALILVASVRFIRWQQALK